MNDELLVSYLLNEGNDEARQQVERWIIEHPDNRRYFEHFRIIWETSQDLALPAIDENEAWKKFKRRIEIQSPQPIVKKIGFRFSALRIAASLLLGIGLAAIAYLAWDATSIAPVTVAVKQQPQAKTLPDGSEVTLNKNSSVSYIRKFNSGKRKIALTGEAFFKVVPNKKKPFIIDVNDLQVTVIGTSFNIKTLGARTEIVVETGKVLVKTLRDSVLLQAGEKIITGKTDSVLVPEKNREQLYNYYRTRQFVCDDTPLWKLVDVLNEAYDANIEIGNPEIRDLPLTTTFYNESLDTILEVITETFDISVERQNNRIILK